jgi:hypothetical protein
MWQRILDAVGCSFALLRRACWPALEECYAWIRDSIEELSLIADGEFSRGSKYMTPVRPGENPNALIAINL